MRATVGPILAHLVLLAAGYGVLYTVGELRRPTLGRMVAIGGLAYLSGMSVVMIVLITLVVIGVPLSLPLYVVVCVVTAAPILLGLRHRSAWTLPRPRASWHAMDAECRIALALAVAVAVFGLIVLFCVGLKNLVEFDAWQLWTRKASLMFWYSHIPTEIFASKHAYLSLQPDYPMLLPMLEAMQFRAGGRPDAQAAHATTFLVFMAGVWAFAYLGWRTSRPFVAIGIPAGVAAMWTATAASAYADVPLAVLVGTGVLATGFWLQDGRGSDLALAAVLLGAAASTKNEGLPAALIVFFVAIVVCLAARRRRDAVIACAAGLVTVAVAIVPWRIWQNLNDVHGMNTLSDGVNPGYLIDHFNRVWPAVQSLTAQLYSQPITQGVLVLGLVLAAVCIRTLPTLASFYLGVGVLYFVSLVWAYWISPLPITFHIVTSADRVVDVLVAVALAALLHLAPRSALTRPVDSPHADVLVGSR